MCTAILDGVEPGLRDHPVEEQPMLLRVEQAAKLLNLGRSTIYDLIGEGSIPTVRCGRAVRIARSDLLEWVNSRRSAA